MHVAGCLRRSPTSRYRTTTPTGRRRRSPTEPTPLSPDPDDQKQKVPGGEMTLSIVWFVIVAFFWTGFFVLEGFDFGVGVLHKIVGRTDLERRVAINTVGPVWDGNEVW